jgi:hypothetical protein
MSWSLSELFALKSDSKWPTGGHFEFSKMGGDVKQLLPIFEGVRAIDNFLVYIESRHTQPHADVFGFLISRFLTEISAIFFRKKSEIPKFHHVWVYTFVIRSS